MHVTKHIRLLIFSALISITALLNAQSTRYIVKGSPKTQEFSGGVFIGWGAKITGTGTTSLLGTDSSFAVVWTDLTGITQTGDTLTKTASTGWGNAGAASYNHLQSLENGWVNYKVSDILNTIAFGLSIRNPDAGFDSIEYAVAIDSGQVQVYNQGISMGSFGSASLNDSIRIERIGDVLFYTKNQIVFFNQQVNAKQELFIDVALYTTGTTITLTTTATATYTSAANLFIINAGSPQTICSSTTARLGGSPTAFGGIGPYIYSWSPSSGLNSNNVSNPIATASSTATYTLSVTDSRGINKTNTVTINILSVPVASAGSTQTICPGASVSLGGSPTGSGGASPYRYFWSPVDSLNYDTIANPTATPTFTTPYTVTVMDTNNCYASSSVTINVKPAIYGFAGNDTTIFKRDSLTIGGNPTAAYGTAPFSYSWSPSTALSDDTLANPKASPSATTSYIVTISDAAGCQNVNDTIIVTIDTLPSVNAGVDIAMCLGDSIIIGGITVARGATLPYTYIWSPSTGLDSANIANPKASPSVTTTYAVVVEDANGYTQTDTTIVTVNAVPSFNAGNDTITYSGNVVLGSDSIASGGTPPYSYSWTSTDNIVIGDIANPFVRLIDTTTFYLVVSDSNYCQAKDTVTIGFDNIFGSICDLDSCTWTVNDLDSTNYTVGSGQKLCIRSSGIARGTITLNSGGRICSSGKLEPSSFAFNGGILTNNATGTIKLGSNLSFGSNAELINDGVMEITGSMLADTGSVFSNTGNIETSGQVQVKTLVFNNYGVITLNTTDFIIYNPASVKNYGTLRGVDSFKNNDTLSLGDNALVFATNYYNYSSGTTKKITTGSSSSGGIVVCSITENYGNIIDSIDICDKSPSAGPVYMDVNTGTIDSSVTYCQTILTLIDSSEVCGNCTALAIESNGCEGDLIIFTAVSSRTFDNYEFFKNDTSVKSSAESTYSLYQAAVEGDVYKVKGTSSHSPCKFVTSDTLTILQKPTISISGDTIAVADSVTLTASGASTYIWTTADGTPVDTGASIIVFPSVTTTYIVSGTNSNGCTGTASHQVKRPLKIIYSIQTPSYYQPFSGSIDITMAGGKMPFTFLWNTGSKEPNLNNLPKGIYHIAVTDADGQNDETDINIGSSIEWTASIGVTATGNGVIRTVAGNGWDTAGAVSADIIGAGQNGWAEFRVGSVGDSYMFGLGTGNNNGGYTAINYAINMEYGTLKVYESGTLKEEVGTCIMDDVIKIERVGTSVRYRKNDEILYTSTVNSESPLVVNTAIYSSGGEIPFLHGNFTEISYEHIQTMHLLVDEIVCEGDLDRNYMHTINYDEDGNAIADGKVYYDYLGRATQTQVRAITDNDVIASQTLYDAYGRVVLQTLPAPIGQSDLCYKDKFITNASGVNYSVTDFDVPNYTEYPNTLFSGEVDRPKGLGKTVPDNLGWYYSNNNFKEPYTPASSFPYTRVEYDNNNGGAIRRLSSAGENLKMGSKHEIQTYQMPTFNETDYLYGKGKGWIVDDYSDSDNDGQGTITPGVIAAGSRVIKTVSVDQNGQETVVFNDLSGKSLASCLSGLENGTDPGANMKEITTTVVGVRFIDVHLPKGCESSLVLTNPNSDTYNILNLKTGKYVTFSNNSINFNGTHPNLQAGFYRLIFKWGIHSGRDGFIPTISVTQNVNYYNFTIHYYDKAGRLKLTVPPAGAHDTYVPATGTVPDHMMIASTEYNSLGSQLSATSPDAGITMFLYAKDGRLRFSQNARQRASNADLNLRTFSYINYDEIGRVVETGEYDPTISGAADAYHFDKLLPGIYDSNDKPAVSALLESNSYSGTNLDIGRCTQQSYVAYDVAATPFFEQKYLLGKVSKTWNAASATLYNYDELGRTESTVQSITDMPTTGITAIKTINYTYDFNGNVTEVAYQKEVSSEYFYHYYEYDADKRLKKVYTSADGGTTKQEQSEYLYYKHGPLKRVELANKLQGIDYVYTINGWLKSVNNPELNQRDPGKDGTANSTSHSPDDLFGMTLDYFAGDYSRAGTYLQTYDTPENYQVQVVIPPPPPVVEIAKNLYNGIIKGQRWQTVVPTGATVQYPDNQLMSAYLYDNKYQLTSSIFGTITLPGTLNQPYYNSGSAKPALFGYKGPTVNTADNDYKVWNVNYDRNGNITTLNRNGFGTHTGGLAMDELSYNYNKNIDGRLINNKLRDVTDAAPTTSPNSALYTSFGFKHGQSTDNYTYDQTGQQTEDNNGESFTEYDVYGKVIAVYQDAAKETLRVNFTYDEKGFRLKKSAAGDDTWYIRDASGNPLSIYEKPSGGSIVQKEINIYGDKRLGVYNVSAGTYLYELMDHLGNVRSTFESGLQTTVFTGFDKNEPDDYLFTYNANIDNTYGYTSAPSVKLLPGNTYGIGLLDIPVTSDQVISGTINYKTSGTTSPDAMLAFAISDATTGALLDWTPYPIAGSTSWTTLSFTYPVNYNGLLRCYPYSNDPTQTVWFDDLNLTFSVGGIAKAEPVSITDYYAHGSIMPGRNYVGTSYRYGYQGQFAEKDDETNQNSFELRDYDPLLARWLTRDPAGQYHSPYVGMGNNPINYTDHNGAIADAVVGAIMIGAVVGSYCGYQVARAKGADGGDLAGYVFGGAAIGALSGYAGASISAASIPAANTLSIAASSTISSTGFYALSEGKGGISTSFGFASYNWTNGDVGYLGEKGNSVAENVGYGFGALANVQDIFALGVGENIEYNSLKDPTGHASITNEAGTINISKGYESGNLFFGGKGKIWGTAPPDKLFPRIIIRNVNKKILEAMTKNIVNDKGIFGLGELDYGLVGNTCASQSARALWGAGVWGVNPFTIHPSSLYLQLMIRQTGIAASPYLYQIPNIK